MKQTTTAPSLSRARRSLETPPPQPRRGAEQDAIERRNARVPVLDRKAVGEDNEMKEEGEGEGEGKEGRKRDREGAGDGGERIRKRVSG